MNVLEGSPSPQKSPESVDSVVESTIIIPPAASIVEFDLDVEPSSITVPLSGDDVTIDKNKRKQTSPAKYASQKKISFLEDVISPISPVTTILKRGQVLSRGELPKLTTVFKTTTYHHKVCKCCDQVVPPQKFQKTKEELYFEIDTAIIQDKDDSFKKFFTAVGNCWGGSAICGTYDQQRVKDFRAIGVHKPYDIIQKFLAVKKDIGKYQSRLGVKMETGDEIDELEAIIILDAAAYWVSIYHKICDHPINVRNGVPLKEWWIKMKVESFCQTGHQKDERIQRRFDADYMDNRDKCWWYINRNNPKY
jgi:hypothetical protein